MKLICYLTSIAIALIAWSCRDEDTYPIPDITRSSIPVFQQKDSDTGFIDIYNLDDSFVSFDVDRLGSEEVKDIDVWVQFNNSQTGKSVVAEYVTISAFPSSRFDLNIDDIIALFPEEDVTRDTISIGDSFIIGGNVRLSDGRYLSGGFSPSVAANHAVTLTYPVTCSSDLSGTYDLTLVSGDSGEDTFIPDQTIVEISPGYYEISEITMDLFQDQIPGVKYRFRELCGAITADAEAKDYGSLIVVRFNAGSGVDEATGVITFVVEYVAPSCCGLPGIKTTFIATPK